MATEYTETLDTILQDTIPQLPGAVRAVADRELRMAIREFFERSYAWRRTFTELDAPAGLTPIQITSTETGDANSDVIAIMSVEYDGNVLTPMYQRPPRTNLTTSRPTGFYMTSNRDEFQLYPALENPSTGLLTVHLALTPKLDATNFPRQIQNYYYDAIIEGFLSRMYMHPEKPYSNPQLGMMARTNFRRRIGYYNAQAKAGYNGSPAWGYPRGWTPRRPQTSSSG